MRKGHFGCGTDIYLDADNFDKYPVNESVQSLDMENLPYDIKDNTYDHVVCRHVLEHLERSPLDVLMELHRITKPGGCVVVELPIFGNLVSHQRHLHSRNYLNPVMQRRTTKDHNYIRNSFRLVQRRRTQKNSVRKMLWKVKQRFFTWVDSYRFDGYEWTLEVIK